MNTLQVRSLNLAPDVLGLARRVWQAGGASPVLLWSADASGPSYLAFNPQHVVHALDPEPTLACGENRGCHGQVPRWIGVLPYESERGRLERQGSGHDPRPLPPITEPVWLRYGAVAVIHHGVSVIGDDKQAIADLCRCLQSPIAAVAPARLVAQPDSDPEHAHEARIRAALRLIAQGEIYQVNLARRLRFSCSGSSLEILARLEQRAHSPFCGAIDLPDGCSFVSTSPELCLMTTVSGRVLTMPIKGTRPRGVHERASRAARQELDRDPKERAELAMVVDLERNDLNRISDLGSVLAEAPRVLARTEVFHREALVSGRLRQGISRTEILRAVLPSGSVTGAPKIRAMEVVAQLEASRRGAYTGAWGCLTHDGTLQLGMNIRCLSRQGDEAEYWVGGGLVADSDPKREVEETRWKAIQVARACEA